MENIVYLFSETLNKKIKFDRTALTLTVKEKKLFGTVGRVTYSMDEINILNKNGELDLTTHRVKNVFDGEIIEETEKHNFKDKYKKAKVW